MRRQSPALDTRQHRRPRPHFALVAMLVVFALAGAFLIGPDGIAVAGSSTPQVALPDSEALPSAPSSDKPSGVTPPKNVSASTPGGAVASGAAAESRAAAEPGAADEAAPASAPETVPPPTTVPVPPPDAPPEVRTAAALARITYPWQTLGYQIDFLGPRPGLQGRTMLSRPHIEVFVRPNQSVDELAHIIAHEIGHAIDLVHGNDARRVQWLQLRGVGLQSWFRCTRCDDFSTPAGDFAETFAYSQLHDYSRSRVAPAPTDDQLAQLAPLFN